MLNKFDNTIFIKVGRYSIRNSMNSITRYAIFN